MNEYVPGKLTVGTLTVAHIGVIRLEMDDGPIDINPKGLFRLLEAARILTDVFRGSGALAGQQFPFAAIQVVVAYETLMAKAEKG